MSEFSDEAFVAGSLTGIRTFRVDKLGRLTAVNFPDPVWTPGENVAVCRKGRDFPAGARLSFGPPGSYGGFSGLLGGGYSVYFDDPPPVVTALRAAEKVEPLPPPVHQVAQLNCTCGYYAYFDNGDNPNHCRGLDVYGVIEGYGRATVGARGFRCEKAVIKALIIKPKHATRLARVASNYAEVAVFPSRADAFEAFPLTPPDPLSPDTTPDFWTRPA